MSLTHQELLALFAAELDPQVDIVAWHIQGDPDSLFKAGVAIGWAMGKGLSPQEASAFQEFVARNEA
jgi:hypothetical protein